MAPRGPSPLPAEARSGKSVAAAKWLRDQSGASFRSAGKKFGVSPQAVQQMWSTLGYDSRARWSKTSESRSVVVNLRITKSELARWVASARRAEVSLSQWLRDAAARQLEEVRRG